MKPIVTRVRMLENGRFVAETKKTFRWFWLFPTTYWGTCFQNCSYQTCLPKEYNFEESAKKDCARYCKEQKEKYENVQLARAYKVQEQTCDELFQGEK